MQLIFLLIESGLILGIPVIILLFFFRKKNRNDFLLALSLLNIWYTLMVSFLNQTQAILYYPYLIRTGNISLYLFFPFLYLYTRNTFYPGIHWRKRDWLFLIPSLFYIIDMMPFFLSDPAYKIAVMSANLKDPSRLFRVQEGWITMKGFHLVFRYIWALFIMNLQIRVIIRNRNFDLGRSKNENMTIYWYLITLSFFYFLLIIPGAFGALLHLKWYTLAFANTNLALVLIATALFLLFSPKILYGFSATPTADNLIAINKKPLVLDDEAENKNENSYKRSFVEKEFKPMLEKIETFMQSSKPYLDQKYSIHHLSKAINIPVYQLSPIINQYYQSNFNSWLNKYRVNYFIELYRSKDRNELTLEALANESGFSNRTTFINAFKKETGTTPAAFFKLSSISVNPE